jgi:serine/threonine protein kinase
MPRPDDKIGPYTLVKQLGRGAFGVVWLAERRGAFATTKVALKLAIDEDPDLDAITQESQLWAKLAGHTNVLPIIEADKYDDQVVIVSEYAPGGSLESWLKNHNGRAPSLESALSMVNGILAGLEHLHGQHIIHRDLKPANILLQGETPRLADFGLARVLKSSGQSAGVAGTPAYMAPETFDGKRSEQSDIWSVGVILYQLLTGNLPYPQTEIISLIGALVRHKPVPLPESVPAPFHQIIDRALQKEPEHRYASALEMRKALQAAMAQVPADISGDLILVSVVPDEAQQPPTVLLDPSPSSSINAKVTDRAPVAQATAEASPATRQPAIQQQTIANQETRLQAGNSVRGFEDFPSPRAHATMQKTVVAERPMLPEQKSGVGKFLAGALVGIIAIAGIGFAFFHRAPDQPMPEKPALLKPIANPQPVPDQQTESSQVKEITNPSQPEPETKPESTPATKPESTTTRPVASVKPSDNPKPSDSEPPASASTPAPVGKLTTDDVPSPPAKRRGSDPQDAQRQAIKSLISDALKQTNEALNDVLTRLGSKPNIAKRPRLRALMEMKGQLESYLAEGKFDDESRIAAEKALARIHILRDRIMDTIRTGKSEEE